MQLGLVGFQSFWGETDSFKKEKFEIYLRLFSAVRFLSLLFFFATKWIKNHFCFNSMPWIFKQVYKKTTTTTTAWWPFDGLWSLLKIGVLWHLTINRFLEVALQFKLYKVTYFSCNLSLEPIFQVTLSTEIFLI